MLPFTLEQFLNVFAIYNNAIWPAQIAASRLNRDQSGSYGTKKYAFEELVAELAAASGCASLGIVPTVRHSDYIGSWLEVLREDNRAIVRAASQASKAVDYLLGFAPDIAQTAAADTPVVADNAA